MIARRVSALWPDLTGLDVLGVGYPLPAFGEAEGWLGQARRVVVAMPEAQGAQGWPEAGVGRGNVVCLTPEERLPLKDALFDRVVLLHALEEAEAPQRLLREVWRLMAPEGRLMVITASRRGVWSRREDLPFGQGRPFTRGQLERALRDGLLEPAARSHAVYLPPLDWSVLTANAEGWEKVGERLWPRLGGVLLIEAVKHVAARPGGTLSPVTAPLRLRPRTESARRGEDTHRDISRSRPANLLTRLHSPATSLRQLPVSPRVEFVDETDRCDHQTEPT